MICLERDLEMIELCRDTVTQQCSSHTLLSSLHIGCMAFTTCLLEKLVLWHKTAAQLQHDVMAGTPGWTVVQITDLPLSAVHPWARGSASQASM